MANVVVTPKVVPDGLSGHTGPWQYILDQGWLMPYESAKPLNDCISPVGTQEVLLGSTADLPLGPFPRLARDELDRRR